MLRRTQPWRPRCQDIAPRRQQVYFFCSCLLVYLALVGPCYTRFEKDLQDMICVAFLLECWIHVCLPLILDIYSPSILLYVWIGTLHRFLLHYVFSIYSIRFPVGKIGEKNWKKELTYRTEQRRKQKKKEKKQEKNMWMGTLDTTVVNREKMDMVFQGWWPRPSHFRIKLDKKLFVIQILPF